MAKTANLNARIEPALKEQAEEILTGQKQEELNTALQKGYDDVLAGRTKPAKQVFDAVRRNHSV